MILAVDIGNSNIHMGFFSDDSLVCSFNIGTNKDRTSDEYLSLIRSVSSNKNCDITDISGIIIGSVVPSVTEIIKRALTEISDVPIIIVGPGTKTGFSIKINDPSELGADLVANAAAAVSKFSPPLAIVDFGTATTVSVIDSNSSYIGGYILPGIKMSLDALKNAELLPNVSLDIPAPAIGKTSRESMISGVIRGEALAVEGFIDSCRKNYFDNKNINIIVTGGHAKEMIKYLPQNTVYSSALTLEGLYEIYKSNSKKNR